MALASLAYPPPLRNDGRLAPIGSAGAPARSGVYRCNGVQATCPTTYGSDAACASGDHCASNACVAKRPNGLSCAAANECASGSCVDGVCCAGFGVVFVKEDESPPRVAMTEFDALGVGRTTIELQETSVPALDANPVLAALPGGKFAVAWNDFTGDGDELGIALRLTDGATTPTAKPTYANATTSFSQYDPDVVWTGTGLVVAWVDGSSTTNGSDVKYRTFDAALNPTSAELPLAETSDAESAVALTPMNGTFAAAYRVATAGGESIGVWYGDAVWRVGDFPAGPAGERPAIAALDATHVLVVYARGAAAGDGTYTLEGAIVDVTTAPGTVVPFAIAAAGTASTREPALVATGAGAVTLAWRAEAAMSTAEGDELYALAASWSAGALTWGAAPELVPGVGHRSGDQRGVAVAGGAGGVVWGWEDLGAVFGSGIEGGRDVVVAVRGGL